jgi:hypothetical protein
VSSSAETNPRRLRLYLDTSAYLCVLFGENGWENISEQVTGAEVMTSVLLVLESRRNIVRLAREGTLTADQFKTCMERVESDTASLSVRDVTLDLCESSPMPALATPRSLDLAHLRTALWFHAQEPLDRFVTMDGSQEQAARELGLPI